MTDVVEMDTTDRPPTSARPASRPVLVWAGIGVVWSVVAIVTLVGWVGGDNFGAPEVRGPDTMSSSKLIGLRLVEVISTGVLAIAFYFLAWRPWRRERKVTLDALLLLGGVTGFVMDCWLNTQSFLFAFNSHSVNLGAWSSSLPFHDASVPGHYAESLLWGLPMYVYFCAALGYVNTMAARRLRARWPGLSTQGILAILFVGDLAFDFVVENLIIRTTEAYSFVQTSGPLTLWAGEQHQFPLYETFLVACVAMCFTYARWSADWDPDGLSVIERGVLSVPAPYRLVVRLLAAIGFCAVVLMMCYHLPFNWISLTGDSFADLPSYLTPAGLTLP